MKITTQHPFEAYNAYLVTNPEKRCNVCLVHKTTKQRTTTSYARYLMSVKEGRLLLKSEQVDHIDGDKTNDVIENLQILSIKENNLKSVVERDAGLKMISMLCPGCNIVFERSFRNSFLQKKGRFSTCSKDCLHKVLKKGLSYQEQEEIGKKQIIKQYRKHNQ
jgi:hypothetical protein